MRSRTVLRRLTNVVYPVSPSLSFAYDALRRLTNLVDGVGTTAYTFSQVGQLSSEGGLWPNDTVSFTYNGRLRSSLGIQDPVGNGGSRRAAAMAPVGLKFTTGAWNLANETRYIYDGMMPIQERDQNNVPLVTYTRGRDLSGSLQRAGGIGGLLARTDMTASVPSHAYYHADGNGNITAMISYQQNLVAKYLFDPFGNILSKSGPLV